MANPTITRKSEVNYTPSEEAKKIFQAIYRDKNKKESYDDDAQKIKVSEIISKMAFYYEKIRNAVEYEEEHLLRKNAIERILKRQIVIENTMSFKTLNSVEISKHLMSELIRAGYLPNNTLPESKIFDIAKIIEKYLKLKTYCLPVVRDNHEMKNEVLNWIMALDASEIEEALGDGKVDGVIIEAMYKILIDNIVLADNNPYQEDKEIQAYIGTYRSFLKFDQDMIALILLKYYNANWQNPSDEEIKNIAEKIIPLRKAIAYHLDHPLAGQISRLISRYTVFFTILKDVADQDPVGIYETLKNDTKAFARKIKEACNKKYKASKAKLWRAAVRSIIYIFVTKSFLAVLLEVPATQFFGEPLNKFALGINITFPAMLLFIIVAFTKLPSEKNSEKIVDGIKSIVYKEFERKEPFTLRQPIKRSGYSNSIFGIIYFITFLFSIAVVISGLDRVGFNWVSIIIFLFFLLFVSFFSVRIRKNARDYIIVPARETFLNLISDFFYIPIVSAGKWLSEKFSRINVFVFVLDFIIEAPFKIFVEIAEEWTRYVKDRRDEIV
jgi:hypothetical protein